VHDRALQRGGVEHHMVANDGAHKPQQWGVLVKGGWVVAGWWVARVPHCSAERSTPRCRACADRAAGANDVAVGDSSRSRGQ
jgi:hypothetical protein